MAPSLTDRVQALPQELQDEIYDFTVSIDSRPVKLNKNYKPPVELQISRETRKKAAVIYYGGPNSTFTFESNNDMLPRAWLSSLIFEHRKMVRKIDTPTHRLIVHHRRDGTFDLGIADLDGTCDEEVARMMVLAEKIQNMRGKAKRKKCWLGQDE